MSRSGALVYGAVAFIVGVTLVSGPAIGLVDLTDSRFDAAGLGHGNATVDDVEASTQATLERGYRSESYRLHVPDARAHVAAVDGNPVLVYRIEIDGLGFSRSANFFLDGASVGWQRLSLDGSPLDNDVEAGATYDGELSIVVRTTNGETVVYSEPITVAVSS